MESLLCTLKIKINVIYNSHDVFISSGKLRNNVRNFEEKKIHHPA
jgi:hypothetical protein